MRWDLVLCPCLEPLLQPCQAWEPCLRFPAFLRLRHCRLRVAEEVEAVGEAVLHQPFQGFRLLRHLCQACPGLEFSHLAKAVVRSFPMICGSVLCRLPTFCNLI